MSKTFDIMFDDLNEDAQKRLLEFKEIDDPVEVMWNYVPIATLVETDEKDEALDNVDDMSEVWQEGQDLEEEDEEEI